MAVSIRLKYGDFERVFDEYIDKHEYVAFVIKSKKASILLAFSMAPPNNFEPLRFRTFMRGFSLTH